MLPLTSPRFAAFIAVLAIISRVSGVTLEDLENQRQLTPEQFVQYFRNFEFRYRDEVQSAPVFLAKESGDCDDYSTLAAAILKKHGYTPRLVAVRMPGLVHVVCYIPEVNAYLDYNLRASGSGLARCGAQLADVARSVARFYGTKWMSASEFTFESGVKRLVATVTESRPGLFASLFR